MKTKQIVGLIVCCAFAFIASDASAATEETKLILPDGKPAVGAVVFSVDEAHRPLLMVNSSSKFLPNLMGANGKEVFAEGDENSRADKDGLVRIDREGQAHLVVAQSGDTMAFVPIGTKGDVRLRKCGRLKMDYSAMQKEVVKRATLRWQLEKADEKSVPEKIIASKELEDTLKNVTVLANWRNSLAGYYALSGGSREYRLHKWFDIQFVFPDPFAEVLMPPGEVSVGLLTGNQVEEMSKFRFQNSEILFNKTLRGVCATSGIHSVSSGEATTPPAFIGVSAKGKLRMRQRYPKWEGVNIFEGAHLSSKTELQIRYPSSIDPDSCVDFLLSPYGKIQRVVFSNSTVWLNNDGTFLAHPAITNTQFSITLSQSNQLKADREKGNNRGFFIEHAKGKPVVLEVAAQPIPKNDIVDFGDVSFSFESQSEITSFDPKHGQFTAKVPSPKQLSLTFSEQTKFQPEFTQPLLSEKTVEGPALLEREQVSAAVKAKINVRKRQLLELEERLKAARERLRKREENIEAIVDRELNKAAKSGK